MRKPGPRKEFFIVIGLVVEKGRASQQFLFFLTFFNPQTPFPLRGNIADSAKKSSGVFGFLFGGGGARDKEEPSDDGEQTNEWNSTQQGL